MAARRNPYSMTGMNAGGILSAFTPQARVTSGSQLYGVTIDRAGNTPTELHGDTNAYVRWIAALSMVPRQK
jgi:hypothetical protein